MDKKTHIALTFSFVLMDLSSRFKGKENGKWAVFWSGTRRLKRENVSLASFQVLFTSGETPNDVRVTLLNQLDVLARRLEDVLKAFLQSVLKTPWRSLEKVLKTAWRRMTKTSIFVLIRTSLRPLMKMYDHGEYICLEDVFWRRRRKTSSRCLQEVFIKGTLMQIWKSPYMF